MRVLFTLVMLLSYSIVFSQNGGGKYTLRQVCGVNNPNLVAPFNNETGNFESRYKWVQYKGSEFDNTNSLNLVSYSSVNLLNPNNNTDDNPLNLNNFPDGLGVFVIGNTFTVFYVWGSKPSYANYNSGSNFSNYLDLEWNGLIVFKQFDLENDACNRRLSYSFVGSANLSCNAGFDNSGSSPNFLGINLTIAKNSEVVVLSGYKAFNRLFFDNGGGIYSQENVKFTSSCNMWGGLWMDNRTKLILKGNSLDPITIENANTGIMVVNDMATYNNDANTIHNADFIVSTKFPFGASSAATVDIEHEAAIIQIEFVNFHNNYFHIYALAQTANRSESTYKSHIWNSNFSCTPQKMLSPYEPKATGGNYQYTLSEACIILYLCKSSIGSFINEQNKLDIKDCNFYQAFYGILSPDFREFTGSNNYKEIAWVGIRYFRPQYTNPINGYKANNQNFNIGLFTDNSSDFYCYNSFSEQGENLDKYWNEINGYTRPVYFTCGQTINNYSWNTNPNSARHGLSTGYPLVNGNRIAPQSQIGVFAPYSNDNSNSLEVKGCSFSGTSSTIGIMTSNLALAKDNYFYNNATGIEIEQRNNTNIIQNKFNYTNTGVRFNALLDNTITDLYNYDIHCNEFMSNGAASGLVFEDGCTNSSINGGFDQFAQDYLPVANIFPVSSGINRSMFYNAKNLFLNWTSPIGWNSIVNNNQNSMVKLFTYKNSFVGNYIPNNAYDRMRLIISPLKCYTQANVSATPSFDFGDRNYTEVCGSSYTSNQIIFPNIGRKAFSSDTTCQSITISPNPSKESINILGLKDQGFSIVSIIDGYGKVVSKNVVEGLSSKSLLIESLANGQYILLLSGTTSSQTFKFIKQ